MRKNFLCIIMILLISSACTTSKKENIPLPITSQNIEQISFEEITSDMGINGFAITSDNSIATIEFPIYNNDAENCFRKYENGTLVFEKKMDVNEAYQGLVFDEERGCYYAYNSLKNKLVEIDENFILKKEIADFEAFEIKGAELIENYLYVVSVKNNPYESGILNEETNGYINFGEQVYKIDLKSGDYVDITVNNTICQFFDEKNLYYYTCENGKYELKLYDTETEGITEVCNMDDVGYIVSFVMCGNKFVYSKPDCEDLYLKRLDLGIISSYANGSYCLLGTDMKIYKGNLIYLDRNSMQIKKMFLGNLANDIETAQEMPFAGTELVIFGTRQFCPIELNKIKNVTGISSTIYESPLNDDEILLKIMACDSDIDIYTLYSSRPVGRSIRKNEIFIPLNDCKNIKNLLSDSFDNISDFCTMDNGDIWAMPISSYSDVIWYIPKNIEKVGLTYKNNFEMYTDFLDTLMFMKGQNEFDYYGNFDSGFGCTELADNYNLNYSFTEYNNEIFKSLFEKSWNGWIRYQTEPGPFFKKYWPEGDKETTYDTNKIAFKVESPETHLSGKSFIGAGDFDPFIEWRAFPLPKIASNNETAPVTLTYAVINPYSNNIDAAKEYLSCLAEDIVDRTNRLSIICIDIEKYASKYDITSLAFKDVFEIYSHSAVYEPIRSRGNEKHIDDYQNGKMTVDEVALYLERQTEMALNE